MGKVKLDMHTHTLMSEHAYNTICEMVIAAKQAGLSALGITDHTKGILNAPSEIYFYNFKVIPRKMYGIDLYLGAEINILDYNGRLSLDDYMMKYLDIRLAGIHDICFEMGNADQNTSAITCALKNPYTDIIVHLNDGKYEFDYEKIVKAAYENGKILEINNNALRAKWRKNSWANDTKMLELCKKYGVYVIMDSDAHFATDIGNVVNCEKIIKDAGFPKELVLNYDYKKFKKFLEDKRKKEPVCERKFDSKDFFIKL